MMHDATYFAAWTLIVLAIFVFTSVLRDLILINLELKAQDEAREKLNAHDE